MQVVLISILKLTEMCDRISSGSLETWTNQELDRATEKINVTQGARRRLKYEIDNV